MLMLAVIDDHRLDSAKGRLQSHFDVDSVNGEQMAMTSVPDAALVPGRDSEQAEHAGFFAEATPQLVSPRARRGRPPVADPKPKVTIRLPRTTLEALRQSGRGWQTRLARLAGEMVAAEQHTDADELEAASRPQGNIASPAGAGAQLPARRKS